MAKTLRDVRLMLDTANADETPDELAAPKLREVIEAAVKALDEVVGWDYGLADGGGQ